jgi:hypothetical protein
MARRRTDKSLLDFVAGDLKQLEEPSARGQRAARRIRRSRARDRAPRAAGRVAHRFAHRRAGAPVGVPESFEDHAELMFDLHGDRVRGATSRAVSAFMLTRELSQRTYPNIGVTEPHHTISHHGNKRRRSRRTPR